MVDTISLKLRSTSKTIQITILQALYCNFEEIKCCIFFSAYLCPADEPGNVVERIFE